MSGSCRVAEPAQAMAWCPAMRGSAEPGTREPVDAMPLDPDDRAARIGRRLLPMLLWLALPATLHAQPGPFAWPDGARAAVSLAYDDALDSQLDHAIPALDRHRLGASFYLTMSAPSVHERMDEWRAAARNGHELGNHSLFHQCAGSLPGRGWVTPEQDLETTSRARMQAQVRVASTMLQAIDGRQARTYTVPCSDVMARDGDYVEGLEAGFVAIRRSGDPVVADMQSLDPHAVPAWAPSGVSGDTLIALVEEAGRRGTMLNLTFHGVGGDHLAISVEAHEQLLAHLAAHRDRYWTAPFLTLMQWVRAQQDSD